MRKSYLAATLAAAVSLSTVAPAARADQVVFKNSDRLSGKIVGMDGGKLKLKSKLAGEVTVDLKEVETFSTDEPIDLKLSDGTVIHQKVNGGKDGTVELAPGGAVQPQAVSLASVKKINPPPVKWTGALTVGGALTRGNTNSETFNTALDVVRRTDQDRITFDAGYVYARQKDPNTGAKNETANNWFLQGKYDYFFSEKFYAYGVARVAKDRIAKIDLLFAPGAGAGYQFFERPDFHLNGEGGIGWFYERYSNDGTKEEASARLAYHVDKQLNDKVTLFHNLEYFPKFDSFDDFYINADAGIRAQISKKMFTEFKVQWTHDNRPAPGAQKDDTRYLLNLGWLIE